jgi:hypothetical protein
MRCHAAPGRIAEFVNWVEEIQQSRMKIFGSIFLR